jgi:hypothetical protein
MWSAAFRPRRALRQPPSGPRHRARRTSAPLEEVWARSGPNRSWGRLSRMRGSSTPRPTCGGPGLLFSLRIGARKVRLELVRGRPPSGWSHVDRHPERSRTDAAGSVRAVGDGPMRSNSAAHGSVSGVSIARRTRSNYLRQQTSSSPERRALGRLDPVEAVGRDRGSGCSEPLEGGARLSAKVFERHARQAAEDGHL